MLRADPPSEQARGGPKQEEAGRVLSLIIQVCARKRHY